jgi:threonine synthase
VSDKWLQCTNCGATYDLADPKFFGCPKCSTETKRWPVEVMYDYDAIAKRLGSSPFPEERASIWRFADLLPVREKKNIVTLDEGGTPLTRIDSFSIPLYVKNETLNPTWSFKDRFNTVNISMARELGYDKVVSLTSGNAGAAIAAYASIAGLRALIMCHDQVPPLLYNAIQIYGAEVVIATKYGAQDLIVRLVQEHGWYPSIQMPVLYVAVPYGVEGYKTIGYEIALQCKDSPPDYVFAPIGGGDGLYGMYKAYKEFMLLGLVEKMPRFCGCQITGADPVVRAYREGSREQVRRDPVPTRAISIRAPISGDHCLSAIYDSGGLAIGVTEEETVEAVKTAAKGGIFAELASAVSIAGAVKAVQQGDVSAESKIVCLVTAAGVKWPEVLATMVPEPPRIAATMDELSAVVEL